MDELYRVGQRVAQDTAGSIDPSMLGAMGGAMGGAGGAGAVDPAAFAEALQNDPALAELLGGGGDIEQYLQSYEQMLSQGLSAGPQLNVVDAEGGITVRPEPGFVVKSRDLSTGMKVFLNIVSNEHIEKPHMKSFAELEGEEGCRVPLSVGTPVEDFDKKNEPCITYDLVANPEVVSECEQHKDFRDSVIQLCFAAIAQKYKVELDVRYKLPKMKYKGNTVQVQRIRKANQSKIQEVSGGPNAAPMPGESIAAREAAATEGGPQRPEFCIFYAKNGAPAIDGFAVNWPGPPDTSEEAASLEYLVGWDLPCYRVNQFQEKIRGTMRNQKEREQQEAEKQAAADAAPPGENETREMLAGRTCVVQVRMPQLDPHIPSLKQFGLEVSDECLRVSFPLLPRSGRAAYAPFTIWWPRGFCASQATADWESRSDTLTVSLPTDMPAETMEFDEDLLNAVF